MANIAKRSDGTWRAGYRDPTGKEHARHFARKVDAQQWLDGVTAAVQTGTYVDPDRAKVTIGDLAPTWITGKINLKASSKARYEDVLRTHVLPRWGTTPLFRIEHAAIQD